MTKDKFTTRLGATLGIGFILFGIVETSVAMNGRDNIGFFWFPTLCGGGALILLGMFAVHRPAWLSAGLVTVGALAGGLATSWTVVVPILALTLIVLVILRSTSAVAVAS